MIHAPKFKGKRKSSNVKKLLALSSPCLHTRKCPGHVQRLPAPFTVHFERSERTNAPTPEHLNVNALPFYRVGLFGFLATFTAHAFVPAPRNKLRTHRQRVNTLPSCPRPDTHLLSGHARATHRKRSERRNSRQYQQQPTNFH